MASFLDKAGLTKFWENVKSYIDQNYLNLSRANGIINELVRVKTEDNNNKIYNNIKYIEIPKDITLRYMGNIEGYTASVNESYPYIRIFFKFYHKILLLKKPERNDIVNLTGIIDSSLKGGSEKYLGRLPEYEIYSMNPYKIYNITSFDIYLKKITDYSSSNSYRYYFALIPVNMSNSYTLNVIPGKQMIRYLGVDNIDRYLSSYKFYKVNLVTDSPLDFNQTVTPGSFNRLIDRMFNLYNRHDIEYIIRYPRYLNGLLTFLKYDHTSNKMELVDKTNVVDGTNNEVVLTKDTGLYMYGDIGIDYRMFNISEEIKFDISSNEDTTGKLLILSGDISTIYGLMKNDIICNNISTSTPLYRDNFKLFHSQYIGQINITDINGIPFDPIIQNIRLYHRLFNNTGISTAISAIHLMGDNPYMNNPDNNGINKNIINNYQEAYRNCNQLTKLIIYIYLEGDLNLDSTLDDYYKDNFYYSVSEMVRDSDNITDVVLLPGVLGGLSMEDFEKFSKLMKPIADKLKEEEFNWNVKIQNGLIPGI